MTTQQWPQVYCELHNMPFAVDGVCLKCEQGREERANAAACKAPTFKVDIPEMVAKWQATPGALIHPDLLKSVQRSPLAVQVAGDHYKKLKIQPIEYIHANGIPFAEGNVIKYVTRWRDKGGIKDLEKARHFIDLLIELEKKGGAT